MDNTPPSPTELEKLSADYFNVCQQFGHAAVQIKAWEELQHKHLKRIQELQESARKIEEEQKQKS